MPRRKIHKFWRWLLRIVLGLLLAFAGLVAWAIWQNSHPSPQDSLDEGLKFIQANDVYLKGDALKRFTAYLQSKPKATSDEDIERKLRKAFEIIGDSHGAVAWPTDNAAQSSLEYASGAYIVRGGHVLGYYVNAPNETQQLKVGDQILSIDGADLNHLDSIADTLNTLKLHSYRVKRHGKLLTISLHHHRLVGQLRPVGRMLTAKTGYLLMAPADMPDLPSKQEQPYYRQYADWHIDTLSYFKRPLCGLVVDLRANSGGAGSAEALVGSMFLGKGRYVHTAYPNYWLGVDDRGAGYMAQTPGQPESYFDQARVSVPPQARVSQDRPWLAVLTNENTASSGEMIVIAAKTNPKTRTFGEMTFGAITGRYAHTLPNRMEVSFSTSFMTDVNGKVYDKPIVPDVFVKTDYSTFGSPSDPVLLKAQQWLKMKGCS